MIQAFVPTAILSSNRGARIWAVKPASSSILPTLLSP